MQAAASDGRRFFMAWAIHGTSEDAYINELAAKLSEFFTFSKSAIPQYPEIVVLIYLA
jgi:hypothetical protein